VLVSKWEKTLADMFPHKIESLPRRAEAFIVALKGQILINAGSLEIKS